MKIAIFSSSDRRSQSGNWVTAQRWKRILADAGHRVAIVHDARKASQTDCDLLIGLHARRSSQALLRFRQRYPQRLTMVALTGTDLYRDLSATRSRHPPSAIRSLEQASQILLLQPRMRKRLRALRVDWQAKSSLVMMDATPRGAPRRPLPARRDALRVCVVGHMRSEKDPLRTALALREFPEELGITAMHAGRALSDSFARRAEREQARNPNWNWCRAVNRKQVDVLMESSDLLVNSSRVEGAPNVLFEAIGVRLPVLATKIDGHVGVLGSHYPGYFSVGDTAGLRRLLLRCRREIAFYQRLLASIDQLAAKYSPGSERRALLAAITKAAAERTSKSTG